MLQTVLFYLISVAMLASAIGVVTTRSAVYGVLCLVSCMCMVAGLFILLKAYLVATVLVLVYAGAILVLFLFVVMLIDFKKINLDWQPFKLPSVVAACLGLSLFLIFYQVIQKVSLPENAALEGTSQGIAAILFSRQALPFELTSFLLLAAVVSVVVLAKKDAS